MRDGLVSHSVWWLAVGMKVLIGMIFLSAGVSKALRRSSLERMVRHHGLHHPLLVHWVSVGDSPLFIFREGKLMRLNADHSLAPLLDERVRLGGAGCSLDEVLPHVGHAEGDVVANTGGEEERVL